MNATVTKLQTTTKTIAKPKTAKAKAKANYTRNVGIGHIAVALVVLTLSLTDISAGVQLITNHGVPTWQAWALALGFECGYVVLELGTLAEQNDKKRKAMERTARPMIWGLLAGSAALNALVFSWQSTGYAAVAASIVLGIAIPAMVYVLTKRGADMLKG